MGVKIRWSDTPKTEKRSLEQVSDIGIAFEDAIDRSTGVEDATIPAVYRSLQVLTDIVASLSMQQVTRGVADPETPSLLANPNPAESYHTTLAKVMSSLLFRGNAYLWPRTRESGTGFVTSAMVLNPDEVTCVWDRRRLYPEYTWKGQPMERDSEIVHIPLNSWPGRPDGVSPVTAARLMLSGAKAEQNLSRRLMEDDATPSGVVEVQERLTQPEAEAIQAMWEESHGTRKRPAVMSGGSKFVPLTFSPVDAQFLETRNFSVQEIARMFGLHGFFLLVESGDSLTYSTTEGLFRMFLAMTLGPTYLARIESAFSRLLPSGKTARFNVEEILRADQMARFEAYKVGLDAGFLTVDEVRAMEGLPPGVASGGINSAGQLAAVIQKLYLGVGKVLTAEEARVILKDGGAVLGNEFQPDSNGGVLSGARN